MTINFLIGGLVAAALVFALIGRDSTIPGSVGTGVVFYVLAALCGLGAAALLLLKLAVHLLLKI